MAIIVFRDPRLDQFEAVRPKRRRKVVVIIRKTKAEAEVDALTKTLRRMKAMGADLRDLKNIEA